MLLHLQCNRVGTSPGPSTHQPHPGAAIFTTTAILSIFASTVVFPVNADVDQLRKVHFDTDEATLDTRDLNDLEWNAHVLREHPEVTVTLVGHTDTVGSVSSNVALGMDRAQAVYDYLIDRGVSADQLDLVSAGEAFRREPVTGPSLANRRVEFVVDGNDAFVDGSIDAD